MKVVWSLVTAAILGLVGWSYGMGVRVAVAEVQVASLKETMGEVKTSVRDTNALLREALGK
jgi:hypothetical protein